MSVNAQEGEVINVDNVIEEYDPKVKNFLEPLGLLIDNNTGCDEETNLRLNEFWKDPENFKLVPKTSPMLEYFLKNLPSIAEVTPTLIAIREIFGTIKKAADMIAKYTGHIVDLASDKERAHETRIAALQLLAAFCKKRNKVSVFVGKPSRLSKILSPDLEIDELGLVAEVILELLKSTDTFTDIKAESFERTVYFFFSICERATTETPPIGILANVLRILLRVTADVRGKDMLLQYNPETTIRGLTTWDQVNEDATQVVLMSYQLLWKLRNYNVTFDANEYRPVSLRSLETDFENETFQVIRRENIPPHETPTHEDFRGLEEPVTYVRPYTTAEILENVKQLVEGPIPSYFATNNCIYRENRLYTYQNEESTDALPPSASLRFESNFECGNLAAVYQHSPHDFSLVLNADTNDSGHVQWFYFKVYGMNPDEEYRFHIVNLEKPGSSYRDGLKVLMFNTHAAQQGKIGWRRSSTINIYQQNGVDKLLKAKTGKVAKHPCYSAILRIKLPEEFKPHLEQDDGVFMSYCYPYSYRNLMDDIHRLSCGNFRWTVGSLCTTLGGNDCPLIEITDPYQVGKSVVQRQDRKVIVVSARVHPGETNSSFIMLGMLELFSDLTDALVQEALQGILVKIVPMLNPDGVIAGNHRCNLLGIDLNRKWASPDEAKTPTVYYCRKLISDSTNVQLYLDLHGHSCRTGTFLFGCDEIPCTFSDTLVSELPEGWFALDHCHTQRLKKQKGSARVAVFEKCGIEQSFTLETSTFGTKTQHFRMADYKALGRALGRAALRFVQTRKDLPKPEPPNPDSSEQMAA